MQLILNDLMGEYMITADDFAADALLAAASNQGGWDGTLSDLLTLNLWCGTINFKWSQLATYTHVCFGRCLGATWKTCRFNGADQYFR
jgi:hypothetical protein